MIRSNTYMQAIALNVLYVVNDIRSLTYYFVNPKKQVIGGDATNMGSETVADTCGSSHVDTRVAEVCEERRHTTGDRPHVVDCSSVAGHAGQIGPVDFVHVERAVCEIS